MAKSTKKDAETEMVVVTFCGAAAGVVQVPVGTAMRDAAHRASIDLTQYAWQDLHDGGDVSSEPSSQPITRDTTYTLVIGASASTDQPSSKENDQ